MISSQWFNSILASLKLGVGIIDFHHPDEISLLGVAMEMLDIEEKQSVFSVAQVFQLDNQQNKSFQSWLQIIQRLHSYHDWNRLCALAPFSTIRIGKNNRVLSLNFKKMVDADGRFSALMIECIDHTEPINMEGLLEQERSLHNLEVAMILTLINTPYEELAAFFSAMDMRINKLIQMTNELHDTFSKEKEVLNPELTTREDQALQNQVDAIYLKGIAHELHTLKGDASTYGFDLFASYAHKAESQLESIMNCDMGQKIGVLKSILSLLDEISAYFIKFQELNKKLFGEENDIMTRVPLQRITLLKDTCAKLLGNNPGVSVQDIVYQCERLTWRSLNQLTQKYVRVVQTRAQVTKKNVKWIVKNNDAFYPQSVLEPFDELLVHLISNAVIHGIEFPDERIKKGKNPEGTITFSIEMDDCATRIIISDNGSGINTDIVMERCIDKKILTKEQVAKLSEHEKQQYVFCKGISTSTYLSQFAGRGMGLEIVKAKIERLKGTVVVTSMKDNGTQFTLTIPNNRVTTGI